MGIKDKLQTQLVVETLTLDAITCLNGMPSTGGASTAENSVESANPLLLGHLRMPQSTMQFA